ncbi:sporulation protein [Amycolatopsis acidicola]|uniref:Sporulation protein n=1 Tax=Amycolatopsis acidicola TaxID=2596893 RepID=A0A5N0UHS6_9PSEU|nr:spore germination protein GerW family protein [Amycolatopsis acidicola]KAA9148126.1 sporulation protein [Amycolatopsis acidicola]
MKVQELVEKVKNSAGAEIVYARPYEKDGVTVIAAASVASGAGGGDGVDKQGQHGEGGGYGLSAKPTGAYIIKDGSLRWEPAVDVNRVVAMVCAVLIVALLLAARIVRLRAGVQTRRPPRFARINSRVGRKKARS